MKHSPHTILSELTDFLSGVKRLNVPVYTVWDSIEDVEIVKKFSSKQCHIPNLFLLDENSSHLLDIGGVYLRLFGLGGAVDPSKVRSLIELARSVWDPSETIVLISYASPRKERALGYLASVLYVKLYCRRGVITEIHRTHFRKCIGRFHYFWIISFTLCRCL
jgi:hypothetical protein